MIQILQTGHLKIVLVLLAYKLQSFYLKKRVVSVGAYTDL